jgi:hypothetical protein
LGTFYMDIFYISYLYLGWCWLLYNILGIPGAVYLFQSDINSIIM